MATWTTDVGHLPPDDPSVPLAARRRAEFTRHVVEAATSWETTEPWLAAVVCVGRVGRQRCRTWISVARLSEDLIEWTCGRCGDRGTVSGFEGSVLDLSDYRLDGEFVTWGIDAKQQKLLLRLTASSPEYRSVLARARPHDEIRGLLIINATLPELDELHLLIEARMDGVRSKRERAILDGLLSTLWTSTDGF